MERFLQKLISKHGILGNMELDFFQVIPERQSIDD